MWINCQMFVLKLARVCLGLWYPHCLCPLMNWSRLIKFQHRFGIISLCVYRKILGRNTAAAKLAVTHTHTCHLSQSCLSHLLTHKKTNKKHTQTKYIMVTFTPLTNVTKQMVKTDSCLSTALLFPVPFMSLKKFQRIQKNERGWEAGAAHIACVCVRRVSAVFSICQLPDQLHLTLAFPCTHHPCQGSNSTAFYILTHLWRIIFNSFKTKLSTVYPFNSFSTSHF